MCKLRKSLYGLKRAPRQWYKKLEFVVEEQDYKRTSSDYCVFVQKKILGMIYHPFAVCGWYVDCGQEYFQDWRAEERVV